MATSYPESDCETSSESCVSTAPVQLTGANSVYASDSSSNFSCSSSSTDTSGSSTRRSSWERSVSMRSNNSKPHKAHDAAWTAIRSLMLRDGNIGITHFKLLRKVGHGDIGSVYLSQLRGTTCVFAMKVMDKETLSRRKKLQRMHIEREILEFLDHPFLPTLYAHFDSEQFSCLVMEFCPGGDLHELRQQQAGKRFGLKAVRFYAAEVLLALEYLHMLGVVYRDLKPENVLVREDGHIMLTDFDLSLKSEVQPALLRYKLSSTSGRRGFLRSSSQSSSASVSSLQCMFPPFCISPCSIHPLISCLPIGLGIGSRKPTQHPISSQSPRTSKKPADVFHSGHTAFDDASNHPAQAEFTFLELVAEPTEARSMSFVGTHEYLAPEILAGFGHGSAVDWWTFGIFLFELLFGRTPFKGTSNDQTLLNIIRQQLRFPVGADIEAGEPARNLIHGLLTKDPRKRLGSSRGAAEIKQHPFFRSVNWALIRCTQPPDVPRKRNSCRQETTTTAQKSSSSFHHIASTKRSQNAKAGDPNLKSKIWTLQKIVSDSLPQFEYF